MKKISVFFLFLLLLLGATANSKAAEVIKKLEINGLERINPFRVQSIIGITEGEKFQNSDANQVVKTLYGTNLFSDVKVDFKNGILAINLKENPMIKEIVLKGNKKVKKDIIEPELRLKARDTYSEVALQKDMEKLREIYKTMGMFRAKIEYEIKQEEDNQVSIIYHIEEGKKAKIKKIYFIGNEKFKSSQLKGVIFSKEKSFYRFGVKTVYDGNRLDYDAHLLKQFYMSNGYIDFEVITVNGQVSKDYKEYNIIFVVSEGNQYRVNDVKITNHIKQFDEKLLQKVLKIKKGDIFNAPFTQTQLNLFQFILSKYGYAFVNINPQIVPDKEKLTVNIDFVIEETQKFYIGKIKIKNNTRTYDEIIRRELNVMEGDPYNIDDINRSIQKLRNMGLFENVSLEKEQSPIPNQVDLIITVVEGKTGDINFGIGYSTLDGLTGNIRLNQRNLFGRYINMNIELLIGFYNQRFSFGYAKPYFLGQDIYAGFNVFYNRNDNRHNSSVSLSYNEEYIGFSLFAKYYLSEYLYQQLDYNFYYEKLSNIAEEYKNILPTTGQITSKIGTTFIYDRRDRNFNPTKGFYGMFNVDLAGLGGNKSYIKTTGKLAYYIPFYKDQVVFKIEASGGYIHSLFGNPLYPNDGFYLGGYMMRGFTYGGIGPRLRNSAGGYKHGESIGGTSYYLFNAELKFPIGLPKDFGVYAVAFINAGTVTGVEDNMDIDKSKIKDSGSIRSAAGLSIMWDSPMGTIGFDFSKIIKKEYYDVDEVFRFNIGTKF